LMCPPVGAVAHSKIQYAVSLLACFLVNMPSNIFVHSSKA